MYPDDNNQKLVPNQNGGANSWIRGSEDYMGNQGNTNVAWLIDPGQGGLLGGYSKNPAIYKCPLDKSKEFGTTGQPRIRSVSMSQAMGPDENDSATAKANIWFDPARYQTLREGNRHGQSRSGGALGHDG